MNFWRIHVFLFSFLYFYIYISASVEVNSISPFTASLHGQEFAVKNVLWDIILMHNIEFIYSWSFYCDCPMVSLAVIPGF